MDRGGSDGYSARILARLAFGVVVFDNVGLLVEANPAAERLLGGPLRPPLGINQLIERLGGVEAGLPQLGDGQRVIVVVGGALLEFEVQHLEDGARSWLIVDRSEELRLRAQLAEEASLLAHGNDAFLVVDGSGLIRYANGVCERALGYPFGALVGRNLSEIERPTGDSFEVGQGAPADLRARLQQLVKEGVVQRYNAWLRQQNGKELPVEVNMRPYRMSQETVVLTTVRDESRRLQHLQDLMAAKAMAEAANRSKSAFLAITSHELRTPLTSIIGFCELLQLENSDKDGNLAHYLRLISEASRSLLNIINDILDLSKIEAKTLEVRVEPMDPDHLVDLLAEMWQQRAHAKSLKLVRQPSRGASGPFYSDPLRLRQVLDNLINNAVKFTAQGAITLGIEHHRDDLVFSVGDTGRGIASEAQRHLFQPFWQSDDAMTRSAGGTGLGLYICRQIAQLLGGTIWLEKSGPDGTAFNVRLPRNVQGQTGLHRTIMDPLLLPEEKAKV